ncbi:MAG: hypothetical protein ABIJ45_05350 [Candidatus Zixiibacteriota bacterium]
MNFRILVFLALILLAGCGDEDYGNNSTENNSYHPVEIEPTISHDGNYVYYVVNDTSIDSTSGVYRALIIIPEKQKMVPGVNLHSPSINFNDSVIAYLDSGKVHYFNRYNFSTDTSLYGQRFNNIFYLVDSVLIGYRQGAGYNDSIFIIDESGVWFKTAGWTPTFVDERVYTYFESEDDSTYNLVRRNAQYILDSAILMEIEEPFLKPQYPSYLPVSNQIVFSFFRDSKWRICTAYVDSSHYTVIDSSDYPKALMIAENWFVYTGISGRLVMSNFNGSFKTLFISD